ncbi:alanine--glyoxylate aminotransferase [Neolewinella marina]|uniref:Alanine--glyoxylate aminotransferase n=2 Tax=Neolewinella marina TaxID=438751 RepID=A0A2G0CKL8_9BACT|nr:alanine--glyoxylate aminotransferase [Neolewinella marina]
MDPDYLHPWLEALEIPPPSGPESADSGTEVLPLPGEVDQNFRLRLPDGTAYLLKISTSDSFDQSPILDHLAGKELPFATPRIVRTAKSSDGTTRVRLHSWVAGRPVATVVPRTRELRRSWGEVCGHLSHALQDLDYPAAERHYKWDPARALETRRLLPLLKAEEQALAEHFYALLEDLPLSGLRRSVCYNDAHEHNLITDAGGRHVCGVIDFGDTVHTVTISELAVACAYAGMDAPDPLGAMREVVEGYHAIFPVEENELEVLFPLICARLLLTVTAAAENRKLNPDNPYLSISETAAWTLLRQLREVHPRLARATFRVACGRSAHPTLAAYHRWAATAPSHPVIDLGGRRLTAVDLGVGSTLLGLNRNFEHLPRFVTHMRRLLEDQEAEVGIGGYGEARPVYTTDAFQGEGNSGPRWRTVHLGLDCWTSTPGTTVYAPLIGTVRHCGNDPTPGGYGGTLILVHEPAPGLRFYTLFGHLSPASLADFPAGTRVQGGQPIARLGGPEENGGWPPHLHFQVMLDLLDRSAEFPGVAYPDTADVWLGLCPDPRTLIPLSVPEEGQKLPAEESLLSHRKQRLGYTLSVSYHRPLTILRGSGSYLYDASGRRFLDTVNNVAHVGHEHPRVVEAIQRQAAVLNTNSRYLHPAVLQLADELTALLPDPLSVVHFVNSGSEANELALRMAESVTGNRRVLAMEMGYHGNTTRTIDVSSYKFARRGGSGQPPETQLLPMPDLLRGKHLTPRWDATGGPLTFLAESILSCGGQLMLPPVYLRQVYDGVRAGGGVTIADEVQTGLGRVGSHWWAFELQGVIPDIVTIGKPFGNGHPLAAVVCTPRVAAAFANGMEYFNTFGGNPVSCAVGLAVLATLREEGLKEQAQDVGQYLVSLLEQLRTDHPLIAEVRGSGLFLGFELASADLAPAPAPAAYLKNRMRELGFLMSTDGPHENVLKIKPPLSFTRGQADSLLKYIRQVFQEDGMRNE